ncbi:Myosin heavy chain-related protein [Heracleum sosnowskyi]|uniref:Myosin heavy chain-related protein n=1 Tax=Heracleum sosnowskyi TaxID=360622 RepID=A0AAD8N4J8_9APIA|nr:Myosin heavy chain-related protein [Heracleum sosnowskyi]
MAFSPALQPKLSSKFCFVRLDGIQKTFALVTYHRRIRTVWIKSVSHDGNPEPSRSLLQRLYNQKQKPEEQTSEDLNRTQDLRLGLGSLESALQVAWAVLKKKEKDLREAEMKVILEHNELNQAKEELDIREEELSADSFNHKKLEEELKQFNLDLTTQATEIEDLKLQVKDRDQDICMSQRALSLKEEEINKMMNDFMRKSEDSANIKIELRSRNSLLNAANDVVKRQELEIQELRQGILLKEKEAGVLLNLHKVGKERLEVAEANLEKQTTAWLLAQEELKNLAYEASKNGREGNETVADFVKVKKLLVNVRSELVLTQKALSSSNEKRNEQQQLLEKQLIELEEQRTNVATYMTSLNNAQIEVDSERIKLSTAEAQNQELELYLSLNKELIKELQVELNEEKSSVEHAIGEMYSLQEHLNNRIADHEATIKLLEVKEEELVEGRLKIQHLSSEKASLQLILEEKTLELSNTRNMLEDVNQEMTELRSFMDGREDQLNQATAMLRETEENGQKIQHELSDAKIRFSEADTIVEQIAELTKDEDYDTPNLCSEMEHKFPHLLEKPIDVFRWKKEQLETVLEITRESLRLKEMEVLAGQRALTIKDGELEMVLQRLDEREKELRMMKEELDRDVDHLQDLYTLSQGKVGGRSDEDLAFEKLQLEAAQLEIEAATSALGKLTEMSQQLINQAHLNMEVDYNIQKVTHEHGKCANKESFSNVQAELAQFSALTDQLVKQAGVVDML